MCQLSQHALRFLIDRAEYSCEEWRSTCVWREQLCFYLMHQWLADARLNVRRAVSVHLKCVQISSFSTRWKGFTWLICVLVVVAAFFAISSKPYLFKAKWLDQSFLLLGFLYHVLKETTLTFWEVFVCQYLDEKIDMTLYVCVCVCMLWSWSQVMVSIA